MQTQKINYFAMPGMQNTGKISPAFMLRLIAENYKQTMQDVQGKSRLPELVNVRRVFSYFAKKRKIASLSKIGQAINRDHATVLYNHKTCADRMSVDKRFRAEVETLEKML